MARAPGRRRVSTRDKFESVLRGGDPYGGRRTPWMRRPGNFIVLLMILVFTVLTFAVKAIDRARQASGPGDAAETVPAPTPVREGEGPMDYEEAKRIFGGR